MTFGTVESVASGLRRRARSLQHSEPMRDWTRTLTVAIAALMLVSACGSAAVQTPATLAPVVATLPAQSATPAATPTSAATPTASASPAPSSSASGSSQSLVAAGKVVFQTVGGVGCQSCHGPDGKGGVAKDGSTAPNIQQATEQKLRDALRGGAALMTNLKLTDADIEAVLAYLAYLNNQ